MRDPNAIHTREAAVIVTIGEVAYPIIGCLGGEVNDPGYHR